MKKLCSYILYRLRLEYTPAGKLTQIPSILGWYSDKEKADAALGEAVREWEASGSPPGVSFRLEPFYQ